MDRRTVYNSDMEPERCPLFLSHLFPPNLLFHCLFALLCFVLFVCVLYITMSRSSFFLSSSPLSQQGSTTHLYTTISSSSLPLPHFFSHPHTRSLICAEPGEYQDDSNMTQQQQLLHRSYTTGSYGPALHDILSDQTEGPYSLNCFAQFLQNQFCHENLAFWLASRQYKVTWRQDCGMIIQPCREPFCEMESFLNRYSKQHPHLN